MKRFFSAFLACTLLAGLLALPASAATADYTLKPGTVQGSSLGMAQLDYYFSEGLMCYLDPATNLWGYIDATGKTVIQPQFERVDPFSGGRATVYLPGDMDPYYVDPAGTIHPYKVEVPLPQGTQILYPCYTEGFVIIQGQEAPYLCGVLDLEGNVLVPREYTSITCDNTQTVTACKDGQYGVIYAPTNTAMTPFGASWNFSNFGAYGLHIVENYDQKQIKVFGSDKSKPILTFNDDGNVFVSLLSANVIQVGRKIDADANQAYTYYDAQGNQLSTAHADLYVLTEGRFSPFWKGMAAASYRDEAAQVTRYVLVNEKMEIVRELTIPNASSYNHYSFNSLSGGYIAFSARHTDQSCTFGYEDTQGNVVWSQTVGMEQMDFYNSWNIGPVRDKLACILYSNGTFSILKFTDGTAPAAPMAYMQSQTITMDGVPIQFQTYALKDDAGNLTNYVKLRDVAHVLNGTAAQFNVGWDGSVNIVTAAAYKANGSEMTTPFTGDRTYAKATAPTNVNGAPAALEAIVLTDDAGNGYTYYKLRDLGTALGFTVDWTAAQGVIIQTA